MGIDLGTTNSAMAIMDKGKPTIIPNSLGERITPSVISFTEDDDILVGRKAKRNAAYNVGRTIFSIKRHMGTGYRVNIDGKTYTPQELSAIIIQQLRTDMESYLGEEVGEAVITVPAYFTDAQRQATRDAGEIAGLNVRRIIDEPTAAAISYGLDKEEDQILMVYDLGGGTFDVSVIEIVSGVFQVLAVKGNNYLGGDDFDQRIVEYLCQEFMTKERVDLHGEPVAMTKLREAAEQAKIELSHSQKTNVLVEAIIMTDRGPLTLDIDLTRAKMENLIEDLLQKTIEPCYKALEDAGLKPEDISNVLLVGGSTRMPAVQKIVEDIMHKSPRKDIVPEEVVALGAAVQSAALGPLDEALEAADRRPSEGPVIVHLTPFSLGVGLVNDQFSVVIPKNSTYPTEGIDEFTTTRDFQTAISFPVYEGESPVASQNVFLDMLRIEAIAPAPKGVPRIKVTFSLDQDRILRAKAVDLSNNNEVIITVAATDNRLNAHDKQRMIIEAQDRVKIRTEKQAQESLLNLAEKLLYNAESILKMTPNSDLKMAYDDLKTSLKSKDIDLIGSAVTNLESILESSGSSITQRHSAV